MEYDCSTYIMINATSSLHAYDVHTVLFVVTA